VSEDMLGLHADTVQGVQDRVPLRDWIIWMWTEHGLNWSDDDD
jgi:hypothetical protein